MMEYIELSWAHPARTAAIIGVPRLVASTSRGNVHRRTAQIDTWSRSHRCASCLRTDGYSAVCAMF